MSRPVTPMLPPKNSVVDRQQRRRPPGSSGSSGSSTCAPSVPVRIAMARVVHRRGGQPTYVMGGLGRGGRGSRRRGRRRPTRRTRCGHPSPRSPRPASAARTSASNVRAMPMPFSCCAHAVVVVELGERPAGEQVVLVGRVHEPAAERGEEPRLPAFDRVEVGRGFGRACAGASRARGCARSRRAARRRASRAPGTGRARRAACRRAPRRR